MGRAAHISSLHTFYLSLASMTYFASVRCPRVRFCRNHEGPHTIKASASDVHTLLQGQVPDVLMGHSLGGKVALEYLRLMQVREPSHSSLMMTSPTYPASSVTRVQGTRCNSRKACVSEAGAILGSAAPHMGARLHAGNG